MGLPVKGVNKWAPLSHELAATDHCILMTSAAAIVAGPPPSCWYLGCKIGTGFTTDSSTLYLLLLQRRLSDPYRFICREVFYSLILKCWEWSNVFQMIELMSGRSQSSTVLAILSRAGQPTNLQSPPTSRPDLTQIFARKKFDCCYFDTWQHL